MTGLRFLFKNGQFFLAVMSDSEARTVIDGWSRYSLKGYYRGVSQGPGSPLWAVDLDQVQCIHTVDPAELGAQAQPPGPGHPGRAPGGPFGSGLNN